MNMFGQGGALANLYHRPRPQVHPGQMGQMLNIPQQQPQVPQQQQSGGMKQFLGQNFRASPEAMGSFQIQGRSQPNQQQQSGGMSDIVAQLLRRR
jgi:hypothetical protein